MNALEHIGEPQAAMMPLIGKIRNIDPSPQLWLWSRLDAPLENTLENIDYLVEHGYELARPGPIDACLESQLYDIKRIAEPGPGPFVTVDQVIQRWSKSINNRPLVPVILSYSVPNQHYTEQISIPLLNPLPLPQHGEYAMVDYQDELYCYSINVLPLEARQRWVAMGDALRALAEPSLWPPADQRHRLAANPVEYQRAINQISTRIQLAQGEEKAHAQAYYILLESAKTHVDQLRKALNKASWLKEWQEIQRMAQDLAGDYYEHHLTTIGAQDSAPAPEPEPVEKQISIPIRVSLAEEPPPEEAPAPVPAPEEKPVPAPSKKKLVRPRRNRTGIANKEELSAISATLNREIINGLRDKDKYVAYKDQAVAEHRHQFSKEKGQITFTIYPLDGEGFDTILAAVNTLGDECIDTHIAIQAIALERNGIEHVRTPFRISPDDILEVRQMKKSNGSYTPWQRIKIIEHLKTLSQTRIIAVMPGPKRRRKGKDGRWETIETTIKAEGAIIDLLSFKIGEYHTITGEELWEERSIAVGEWVTMIPDLNSKTAKMLRQVLKYSAKNERYQKRLGIYLTFMFRINAKNGGLFPHDISMRAVLEGSGIVPERQRGRFRDAIMAALEDLKKHQVIGDYWQVVDSSPQGQERYTRIQEQAYGWMDDWLDQMWNFSPPESLKKQYHKLLKAAPEAAEDD